jgi:hypothetical protein
MNVDEHEQAAEQAQRQQETWAEQALVRFSQPAKDRLKVLRHDTMGPDDWAAIRQHFGPEGEKQFRDEVALLKERYTR